MAINSRTTTANADACRLNKDNARSFTVTVQNQTVIYEVNVPKFQKGENWMPLGGAELAPGYWTFGPEDWQNYGTDTAQGIRFRAKFTATPGIVSVS